MKKTILYLTILFSACSIFPETPEEPNEGEKPFLKKHIQLNDGNRARCQNPIIYHDKVIYFIQDDQSGNGWITAYDKESLEISWTWREAFDTYGDGAKGFGFDSHIYDGILSTSQSNLSYGIDIETGQTIWHHRDLTGGGYNTIDGYEKQIYKVRWEEFTEDASLRIASIYDGEWKELINVTKTDSLGVRIYPPTGFHWEGIDYLAFVSQKQNINPFINFSWLNLYSISNDELVWTSEAIPTNSTNGLGSPGDVIFHDGNLLMGSKSLYSYNIEDGSLEWWRYYGNNFVSIRSLIAAHDGKLYANNESHFFVAVDIHTGDEYFNVASGGSCSQLQFYNGKVFQTSWGNSKFFGFDANTGEKLYDIDSPFDERIGENQNLRFESILAIDPETGLAYTSDSKHLLVYEFD